MQSKHYWGSQVNNPARCPTGTKASLALSAVSSPVTAAVLVALFGMPAARAADASGPKSVGLEEIIVTASRREQTPEEVPYAISVVAPESIAMNSVTDLATLMRQIGVSGSSGAKTSSVTFPIIRGLNASPAAASFRTFEQQPVGVYFDNSPIGGYFQLQDVERIEVLRGPQGTLYGAGALGGALRVIPNALELGKFSGSVDGRVGTLEESDEPSYTGTGVINLPVGDTFAFRVAANYESQPGYIDVFGLMRRQGTDGAAVLADPSDPVNSSGVYYGKKDWNDQQTFTGRASALWQPSEKFSAQLAFTYSDADGHGNPTNNSLWQGGPNKIDPRIILPPGGDFTGLASTEQNYWRTTGLSSLDLSYDVGFATVSATTSYLDTEGAFRTDTNYLLMQPALVAFVPYYAGLPINPRWINTNHTDDNSHSFSQEVRLVSNTGPDKKFDYVAGVFYQNQMRAGQFANFSPGTSERAAAQGCTLPVLLGGCAPITGPNDAANFQTDRQEFEDLSIFGELTWHFAPNWQLTGGIRHFEQDFTDEAQSILYTFGNIDSGLNKKNSTESKTLGKVSIGWEYTKDQHVYALWSQGFRRGGANGLLLPTGPFADIAPQVYKPDTVDNYELGFKGRVGALAYTIDAFFIDWKDPQVSGLTPNANFAVWNAKAAESKGFEFDLNTPLGLPGLSLMASGTYADATLTEDYLIPDILGDIFGKKGQQLPGSPKKSAAATLLYSHGLGASSNMLLTLNTTYTSEIVTSIFAILGVRPITVPSQTLLNASASMSSGPWNYGIYSTNLTNKRTILGHSSPNDTFSYQETATRPREIYFRASYSF